MQQVVRLITILLAKPPSKIQQALNSFSMRGADAPVNPRNTMDKLNLS